jgi:hypothetical protein
MVHGSQYRACLGPHSAVIGFAGGLPLLAVPAVVLVLSSPQRISDVLEALTLGFLLVLVERLEKAVGGSKLFLKLFA